MKVRHSILGMLLLHVVFCHATLAEGPWLVDHLDFFPACTQFSPVPAGAGWDGKDGPLSEEVMRATIDEILARGFTGLESPVRRPSEEAKFILDYAQSRGMIVVHHAGALELFGRDQPPEVCVYSPEYAKAVEKRVKQALSPLKDIPRLYGVFTYQDEPFHWGPKSFGYNEEVRAEFKKRYRYELPPDLATIRDDPQKWLDVINFRTDYFADGWRQVHQIVKQSAPGFRVILTHDSHNTFGGGCGSHAELAIDDVYHWGGDFADMFVFDLYPYMMFDFRFGEPARLPKPRISQMHYCCAQMRNLTRAYGKKLGFWVGTYNRSWFQDYMGSELQAKHWAEREMSTTAVAQGADFLLTGWGVPNDPRHWESLGQGLRLIQKAGGRLSAAPKVKAKACMLFPRTQYVQLQEEYFNVGLSFELFLRAFGELDILHEEQVTDDRLDGYEVLVLFDVKLLPRDVADRIASFVRNGGVLVADCVPCLDTCKSPLATMEKLFGVKDARTERIRRTGHYVPNLQNPGWAYRPADAPDESLFTTDKLSEDVLGQPLDILLVSPRPSTPTTGAVLATTAAGHPGVVHRKVGRGQVFLLGFCLQDTYFKTWQDDNQNARDQLRCLLRAMIWQSGIRPHVWSSNPEVEASIRANRDEGFLFVINHETQDPIAEVELTDLGFPVGHIIDLADGRPVGLEPVGEAVRLSITVGLGETRLLHLLPGETHEAQ
ncbi:MAG: hypothetical protein RBS80_13020 [Thermoguttaceae bacterium]|jgi:hypothetical protein|nr:hypothetical protein [Thermoguttaceae bacterium]